MCFLTIQTTPVMRLGKSLRTKDLLDFEDPSWPIPIWRPRSKPKVPIRHKILNLISRRPSLSGLNGYWQSPPLTAEIRFSATLAVFGRDHRPQSAASKRGSAESPLEVAKQASLLPEQQELVPRRHTQSASATMGDTLAPPPLVHHRRHSSSSAYSSSLGASVLSIHHISSRCPSSVDYTNTTIYTISSETLPILPPVPPPSNPHDRYVALRQAVLSGVRLLYCLDISRQLLYHHTYLVLSILATSGFPAITLVQWERDLDEWWAESSGVLNMARKVALTDMSQALKGLRLGAEAAGSSWAKELRSLDQVFKREPERPRRQRTAKSTVDVPEAHSVSAVAHWAACMVLPPFHIDEFEKEIWKLEETGQIPTGTWTRMYGGAALHGCIRPSVASGKSPHWPLSPAEEDQARQDGLRGVDKDERDRQEREGWRRKRRTWF